MQLLIHAEIKVNPCQWNGSMRSIYSHSSGLLHWHGENLWAIMMTSSNGKISALLSLCVGNSPVSGEFPAQRPVTQSFDVFFDLCLIKRLSKHSRGWWFETLSRPYDVIVMSYVCLSANEAIPSEKSIDTRSQQNANHALHKSGDVLHPSE